jgi:hypothetical protein
MTADNRRCDGPDCLEPELSRIRLGTAFREIVGFDPPSRGAGGQNTVPLKEYTGKLLCARCMERRKQGIAPSQGTLG